MFRITVKSFYRRNHREILFVGKFILYFLAGQVLYSLLNPVLSPLLTDLLTASASAHLIDLISPGLLVTTKGNTILSGGISLNIAIGCDGIEGLIIVLAAVGSFPMSRSRKIIGMMMGAGFVYAANLLRVVALFFTLKYQPDLFSFIHMYIGQVFIIFISVLFFLIWVGRSDKQHEPNC